MNKNRFLSKRLACLLTTALIASPIYLIQTKSAHADAITIAEGATASAVEIDSNLDTVTVLGAVATLDAANAIPFATLTNTITNTTTVVGDSAVTISGAITAATGTTFTLTLSETASLATAGAHVRTGTGVLAINLGGRTITRSGTATSAATFDGLGTLAVTGSTSYTQSIGGTTALTAVTVANLQTMTIAGTAAQTLAATNINGGGAGQGTLAITNTGGPVTVTGAVGTVVLANITTAANTTTNFGGAVAATAATFTGTTSVTGVAAIPTLTVAAGGAATFTTTLASTTSATIADTATGTFNGIVTTPSLVVTGTANINVASPAVAVTTLTAGTGVINISKALVSGNTVFASTNQTPDAIGAGSIFYPANLTNAQTLTIFSDATDNDAGTAVATAVTAASQNNALSTYTAARPADLQTIIVTSTDKSAATTATALGVNTNKAQGLLQARNAAATANTAGTDTAAIDAIFNVLNARNGQSATADTNFANQVAPQTDTIAGSSVAAKAVTSGVQNIMSTRLASLRSGDAFSTGVVTGSGMSANSGFIQAFGSTVEQKNKGNEFGYDADTAGFALGIDGKVSDAVVVGISYANSKTDVDGKGTGKAKNDIKTNSGSIYADYTTKDGYVEGSITYGQSDNKGSRILNTGGLDRTYKSDYDSEQYSFRLAGGVPINLGAGAFFTPFAGATISQIKTDAYTETSTTANDSLRLRVAQDTVDSQVGTVGVKYHQAIKDGKTTFTPEVKLAVNQEFGDDTITSTNTYQGGGTSFKNSTAIEKTSATAGVGLNISSDNVSFNIGYEADVRDKYLGHSAQAKITAKF
jgi:outer membrane autotransporter protein